ncbi:DUF3265 domain-containing protein [Nitrincola tibetensis]|uniref:DUF3265 domain-containing protein n=1 Tax=Nitrincola tibetensis TaxID=2219697 RepID=A0A364NQ21_9GAMM|nr:DUF3265 domain-containing protein [Nitrincola tibetensis]
MTRRSRGTANAWHFYYALVFVIMVLCGSLVYQPMEIAFK